MLDRLQAGAEVNAPRDSNGLSRFRRRFAQWAQALVSVAAIAAVLVLLRLALHYPNCRKPMSFAPLRRFSKQHLAIPV